jgi:hypothetical protein
MKVGANSASVLRELAITIKSMTMSNKLDIMVKEMNNVAQGLQNLLKSYSSTYNINAKEAFPSDEKIEIPIMQVIQVVTFVSLLTEIVSRVEDIVKGVEELSNLAKFQPAISKCEKFKQHSIDSKISPEQQNGEEEEEEEEIIKTLRMV